VRRTACPAIETDARLTRRTGLPDQTDRAAGRLPVSYWVVELIVRPDRFPVYLIRRSGQSAAWWQQGL